MTKQNVISNTHCHIQLSAVATSQPCDDLLVRPAGSHEVIHLLWTVHRGVHALSTLNHLHHIISFHALWKQMQTD